jgi:glycine/D-amino acid oxidase-like deaminating enzyme
LDADVLIVGGGLVGCASAWHLAKAGVSVLLIEQGELNAGASGQNAGSLHFQMERRFLEQGPAAAKESARTIALSRLAIDEWSGLERELGSDLEIGMHGGLMVAESAEDMKLLEHKARLEAERGLPTRLIDGAEARRIAPYLSERVIGASFMAEEGHANPRILTGAFARAAIAAGARIATRTGLISLTRTPAGFQAEARHEGATLHIRAKKVLAAAGAWTATVGAMVNLHLPIFPAGLTMNVTERMPPVIPHLIQHVGRRLSLKQAHDGNVLIGGGWPSRLALKGGRFDLARPAALVPESLRENLRAAVATIPLIAGLNLIRSWTGVVALTPDQLPVVGEVPSVRGFYVAAGGSGFTLGPTFARLLARQIVTGEPGADELAFYSPARFEHLNSFMG